MRIRFLFIILVGLLLVLGGCILYVVPAGSVKYLLLLEGWIGIILVYLVFFHHRLLKPLHSIDFGMDLLREQDFSSRLSRVGQYEADRIVDVFNRMMSQLKQERLRLREQNHFLDLVIQASPMGVIILNFNAEVAQLNPAAARMLRIPMNIALGKHLSQIATPLAQALDEMKLEETREVRLSDANVYKCTHTYFIDQGFHHPFYLIERMTDEVMRAEKKAYEKVIRMIAHEVNNTTAGITSTLDTLEQTLASEETMKEMCEVMQVCVERCYSMSRFITRFADVVKIPEPVRVPYPLNELVAACVRFMEGMCADRNIQLQCEYGEEIDAVSLDAALMERVLVNILKNAAESIGQEGIIRVRTVAPALIEVADNGSGIDQQTAERLFTPFFSTKPHGQGIGLVFIREVLTRHGCSFSLRTDEDGWTRFRISF